MRVGLKMATNLEIRAPLCLVYKGIKYHHTLRQQPRGKAGQPGNRDIATDRKFFPETWLWQLSEVGDSGSVQLPVTVPDTSPPGRPRLSACPLKVLVSLLQFSSVFQPFFLELSLPYSIIRGEVFELKATVFNYLSKCIMVKVTPVPSSDYTLEPSTDGHYSSNGRKTFKWTLVSSVLGVMNVTVSAEAEQSQTVCDNEIRECSGERPY
ncbi:alpha-2-macroglobulin isoform X1 [Tachysurus fulvidraco]|uniref:alpha-2-macroglobulin isoform X1 n=1 Tax=Tachysurus fulvidraco TaxID=1234273 RepID=UPI001FEE7F2E|nr:alpha-2-macroglobulin isoform X1 [Tachysurus fulvidraco]